MLAQRIAALAYGVLVAMVVVQGALSSAFFSYNSIYREQMEAFLAGRLALSENPMSARHDLTWSEGGVHQVWGLGVPLWRAGWHLLARAAGWDAFPDVWAFGLFAAVAAWLVFRAFWNWQQDGSGGAAPGLASAVGASGSTLILLMFPAFFGLLATRFDIYEEAVAYEYLYGLVLLSVLTRLARKPSHCGWYALCLLAGLGGFIRPPLVFYGMAAVGVGAALWWWGRSDGTGEAATTTAPARDGEAGAVAATPALVNGGASPCAWRVLALGLAGFGLGGALLFYTNLARFGSGFEFGHRLNLQNLYGSMYATRFNHPYQQEPALSAAREMLGLLFFARELNGSDFYRQNFFPGQSPTVRWRELYLTTYNPWYWPWLAAGVAAMTGAGLAWWQRRRQGRPSTAELRIIVALGAWGALASAMLFVFYLRNSVISSRYLLDFMPAFGALMGAGWLGWCVWARARRAAKITLALSLVALSVWVIWQVQSLRSSYGAPRLLRWAEVAKRMQQHQARAGQKPPPLPVRYDRSTPAEKLAVPYNGAGWERETGAVQSLIILFVESPEFLELTVRHRDEPWEKFKPDHVRAKVGLELLECESVTRDKDGWRVRFRGPKQKRYQHGLQVAFVVFVSNTHLADRETGWRLIKVEWRREASRE